MSQLELEAAGWNCSMAEALASSNHTPASALQLKIDEAMDIFLQYEGIIGFTGTICRAYEDCASKLKGNSYA